MVRTNNYGYMVIRSITDIFYSESNEDRKLVFQQDKISMFWTKFIGAKCYKNEQILKSWQWKSKILNEIEPTKNFYSKPFGKKRLNYAKIKKKKTIRILSQNWKVEIFAFHCLSCRYWFSQFFLLENCLKEILSFLKSNLLESYPAKSYRRKIQI